MAKSYTSNTLIESVKRRAMLPENSNTFKDTDYLAFANEELDIGVVPLVLSFHEDYIMYSIEIPLDQNKTRYEIPSRAMGNKLREVQFRDDSGNFFELTRIFKEDLPYFQMGTYSTLRAFFIEGNEVCFVPIQTPLPFSGKVVMTFYMRCSELVTEDRVCKITNIDRDTGVITLDSYPDSFSDQPLIDITSKKSPHKLSVYDAQPIAYGNVNNPFITLSSIPDNMNIGDIVSVAEEAIIPQVPSELHGLLSQRVACRCLEALGDTQGLQNALTKLAEMESKAGNIFDDRVEGAPLKIAPKNTILRRNRSYLRR